MKWSRMLCAAAIIVGLSAGAEAADEYQVQMRKTTVRSAPEPLSNVVGEIGLGEKVNKLEEKGAFWKVESLLRVKMVGWIRASAVSKTEVTISAAGGTAQSVSAVEAQMAGRGVLEGERKYVQKYNLQGALAQLDQLEKNPLTTVSVPEIRTFVSEGRITPAGGN